MFGNIRLSTVLLGSSLLASLVLADTSLNAFTDNECTTQPNPEQAGTEDGACQAFTTLNVTSVSIETLGEECTVTVYSDEFCSFDATAVEAGDCLSIDMQFQSFSVDGCKLADPPKDATTSTKILSTKPLPISTETTIVATSEPSQSYTGSGYAFGNTTTTMASNSTMTTSLSVTPVMTTTAGTTALPTPTPTSTPSEAGLSTPAIVGLAVGGILVSLFMEFSYGLALF